MGTDIHLEVEVFKNDRWVREPHPPSPCWSCCDPLYDESRKFIGWSEPRGWFHPWVLPEEVGEHRIISGEERNGRVQTDLREPCYHCQGTKKVYDQYYSDRNYDVFAILANVRNGSGFAGTDTGDGFVPVSPPRGLPGDLSEEVLERLRVLGQDANGDYLPDPVDDVYDELEKTREGYWSLGEHSFSWLTLKEILVDYDWKRSTRKRGVVSLEEYRVFKQKGHPESWSGGVTGSSIVHVTESEMRLIDRGDLVLDEGKKAYCTVGWEATYRERAEGFLEVMEELRQLAPEGDLSRVRIVFGFDS